MIHAVLLRRRIRGGVVQRRDQLGGWRVEHHHQPVARAVAPESRPHLEGRGQEGAHVAPELLAVHFHLDAGHSLIHREHV